jgi:sugar lactone lactonase YvrE
MRATPRLACWFLILGALAAGACDDSGSGTPTDGGSDAAPACSATGMGTLAVTVAGLPAGVNASVSVAQAAGGMTWPVTATQSLPLAAGGYTVTAKRVAAPDAIVRTVYDPSVTTGVPACVRDTMTTPVTVTYAAIPSSNKVWLSNGTGGTAPLLGFASSTLGATGTPAATVAAKTGGGKGLAFDSDGNAWVIGGTTADPPVARYRASMLGSSGPKTPDVKLDSAPFQAGIPGPAALAFDSSGSLWVSVVAARKVVKFTATQIAASGSPTPTVELSGIEGPAGLAFDASGNLWVASGAGRVLKFAAARLAASGMGPDLSLTANTPPPVTGMLPDPIGLAFDASGNLWVNYDGTLARLTATDLAGMGDKTVTPAVQIQLDVMALPEGIAFDESGGLWLAYSQGKFGRLAASQLTASGKQPPQTVITSPDVGYAGWFALYPAPAALPLYHRVP